MVIETLAFYLFAAILVFSALMVITARNPVHSVLFLILGFFNSAGLFVLLGAEFIAMIMVIVYVGAVAVLFLFVVMMLDVDFANLRKGAMRYIPVGLVIGGILLAELVFMYVGWKVVPEYSANLDVPMAMMEGVSNPESLGLVMYTDYVFAFQIAGLVLFVAMIGAIVLTHRRRPGVRRQNVGTQFARKPEDAMSVQKVTSGTGA